MSERGMFGDELHVRFYCELISMKGKFAMFSACKRSSHLPLSCEEAKRNAFEDERTRMRVFIENKIAEALIRYCPRCNTP